MYVNFKTLKSVGEITPLIAETVLILKIFPNMQ